MTDKFNPRVSIIIPVYNQREEFLYECILSAITQTYKNIEVIISDNHSDNNTLNLLESCAKKFQNIRLIRPEFHLSMIENYIFSYSHAAGDYICPLASDDILLSNHVDTLIEPFERYPSLTLSCTLETHFDEDGVIFSKEIPEESGFFRGDKFALTCLKHGGCSFGAVLLKREAFENIGGFDKRIKYAFDVDIIYRLLERGDAHYNKVTTSKIRLWHRTEQNSRAPQSVEDLAIIFEKLRKMDFPDGAIKLIDQCQLKYILLNALPLPVYILFEKGDVIVHEETILKVTKYFHGGFIPFALRNYDNIFGIGVSLIYILGRRLCKYMHILNEMLKKI